MAVRGSEQGDASTGRPQFESTIPKAPRPFKYILNTYFDYENIYFLGLMVM